MEEITKKKNYRRLKHYKNQFYFYIKSKPRPDLEYKIINNIDDHVDITKKYKLLNHCKESDVKLIEKDIELKSYNSGYCVQLNLHVHHYSKIVFDQTRYLVALNNSLGLEPGSITVSSPVKSVVKPSVKPAVVQQLINRSGAFI